jgi:pimeloyl-ACP methyl ester carboxylesterase
MSFSKPQVSEAGSRPAVVCIHAEAASSSQWRSLVARLSASHRVFAPDLPGVGRSPAWPADRRVTLRDEIDLLAPVFAAATGPVFLVGHSYGAAVALLAALAQPHRFLGLALYEPTLFALLEQESPGQPAANGIRCAAADAGAAIERGDRTGAAEAYIDYWMGPGTWRCLPSARRESIAACLGDVAWRTRALFQEGTPLEAFRTLELPVLCMVGAQSPGSTHGVARLLASVLPDVTTTTFDNLGHLGPVTHPQLVNEAVAAFLADCESAGRPATPGAPGP